MKYVVEVSRTDINEGHKISGETIIEIAAKRAGMWCATMNVPGSNTSITWKHEIGTRGFEWVRCYAELPVEALEIITASDNGGTPKPITFEIEVP